MGWPLRERQEPKLGDGMSAFDTKDPLVLRPENLSLFFSQERWRRDVSGNAPLPQVLGDRVRTCGSLSRLWSALVSAPCLRRELDVVRWGVTDVIVSSSVGFCVKDGPGPLRCVKETRRNYVPKSLKRCAVRCVCVGSRESHVARRDGTVTHLLWLACSQ